jgi:Cu/Ag efflux protein CusF
MIRMPKWVVGVLALGLAAAVAAPARAEESVFRDKVKSVNAEKKTFTMTDENGKEFTFKIAEDCIINRGDKNAVADIKEKDEVTVLYDSGVTAKTAHYVLVHTDKNKDTELARGALKSYDEGKKELTITELNKKDRVFNLTGDAKIQLAGKDAKIGDLKLGDKVTLIYETKDNKATVSEVIAERK